MSDFDANSTPLPSPSRIEPLAPGEEGYGKYKIIADDGHIMGYCGDETLRAVSKMVRLYDVL